MTYWQPWHRIRRQRLEMYWMLDAQDDEGQPKDGDVIAVGKRVISLVAAFHKHIPRQTAQLVHEGRTRIYHTSPFINGLHNIDQLSLCQCFLRTLRRGCVRPGRNWLPVTLFNLCFLSPETSIFPLHFELRLVSAIQAEMEQVGYISFCWELSGSFTAYMRFGS